MIETDTFKLRSTRIFRAIRSEHGFSLTELMIAASVAIFVSIGVGLIIVQQQDVENTTLLQSNLDTSHSLMIQKVRNIAGLKTAFGLAADGNNPCFGKSGGGGCAALILPATNPLPPMDAADVTHHDVCVDPPKCYVISNVTYTTSCTVTRCDSITLSVQTSPSTTATSRGQYAKLRKTDITIPGFMFANKMGINFACGASTATLPQTIDYKTLDMSCGPASLGTPVPCANSMPLTYFDDTSKICQSSVTVSCPNGVNRAGIFSGQSGCT